ncbi:MAG TPA: HIT domain-containing protein [Sulfurihydrogenibium sp.]|uniref:HIT family protein n=1 Tax=Sulfurihydrogenibium sp. (strain YO3AOP1) TaxID=436114 RepID=UPI0001726138|nr:HIT domain-containing protein [Sulfurihydrogenibium sp. YO3AOP1]ACD66802.1 histidine triad (HIT) protein [Sulfurihydrogenibium sp. YO3AOP1]HBT98629.1 HIT domain-containing protein [Sulfurihydrogenibium sp.]
MERLYSPWRSQYIEGLEKSEGCFLCKAYQENNDEKNLLLYRGERAFVILNLFPYNAGHLMVCPNEHIGDFTVLDDKTLYEISLLTKDMVKLLKKVLKPDGFNIGYNLGRAAGAGLETHIHNHIVPRWVGDTNFMPVLGEVRVISQDLKEKYYKLKEGLKDVK